MMRNIKAFGLALVAVFVTSAIGAAAASANQFHSAATKTTWTVSANSTQTFQYETGGMAVECTTAGGSGEMTSQTVTEVKFSPTYSECKASGIPGSKVHTIMNGCYSLTTINASGNRGPTHIRCPVGKQITLTFTLIGLDICTLHLGEDTPEGETDYSNSGVTKINVQTTATGIPASRQGSEECGKATSTTGQYKGQVQLKGEETGTANEKAIQVG